MAKERDYRKEYDEFQGSKEQRENRSSRNKARRKLAKAGKVKKGDGLDVDHRDSNPRNNSAKNLRAIPKSKNRSKK